MVSRHGDFRVFPEHLADHNITTTTTTTTTKTTTTTTVISGEKPKRLEQEIFDGLSPVTVPDLPRIVTANTARSHLNTKPGHTPAVLLPPPLAQPPPPPYTPVGTEENQGPACPPPPFPPPRIPQSYPGRKRKQPSRLRVNIHKDLEVLRIVTRSEDHAIGRLPTPPVSVVSAEDMSPGRRAARLPPDASYSYRRDRPASLTPSAIIDEIYCDSPTLGLEDCFDIPIKIEPWTPECESDRAPREKATSSPQPQSSEDQAVSDRHSSSPRCSSPSPPSLSVVGPTSATTAQNPLDPVTLPNAALRRGSANDARSPSLIESIISEDWNADVAVEYGSKPGEREIMPEIFGPMYACFPSGFPILISYTDAARKGD